MWVKFWGKFTCTTYIIYYNIIILNMYRDRNRDREVERWDTQGERDKETEKRETEGKRKRARERTRDSYIGKEYPSILHNYQFISNVLDNYLIIIFLGILDFTHIPMSLQYSTIESNAILKGKTLNILIKWDINSYIGRTFAGQIFMWIILP